MPRNRSSMTPTGAWRLGKAMAGLDVALSLGLPVPVGTTETPHNGAEIAALRALLAAKGTSAGRTLRCGRYRQHRAPADRHSRRLALAPAGADVDTSPDVLLAGPHVSMAEAKRRVVELLLTLRQRDGALPLIYNCGTRAAECSPALEDPPGVG